MITQSRLRELVHYNLETGEMILIKPLSNRLRVGDAVGTPSADGYRGATVDRFRTYIHTLAWIYVFGEVPSGKEIDHKDRNRLNNRINNF